MGSIQGREKPLLQRREKLLLRGTAIGDGAVDAEARAAPVVSGAVGATKSSQIGGVTTG
jgi:hypothetical protein